MKRIISLTLALLLLLALLPAATLAAGGPELRYVLAVEGELTVGSVITVTFSVSRTDAGEGYHVNALQNEIEYDGSCFVLEEGSLSKLRGGSASVRAAVRTDGTPIVAFSDMLADYGPEEALCSFRLRITGENGTVRSSNAMAFSDDAADPRANLVKDASAAIVVGTGVPEEPPEDIGGNSETAEITVTPVDSQSGILGRGERRSDGSIVITATDSRGRALETVPGGLRVRIPKEKGQVAVVLNEAGEIVELLEKSYVEGDTAYLLLDGPTTVKIINNAKDFEDVSEANWFYDAAVFASSHELFQGVAEGVFAPGLDMTRAMMATVLWRLENRPEPKGAAPFLDVPAESWYSQAVSWAAEERIVLGMDEEHFAPNAPVTREQMATLLYRYLLDRGYEAPAEGELEGFADAGEVSSWAMDAMRWAVGIGLIRGRTTDTLAPKGTATRAEVATMFMRFVEYLVK